MSDREMVMEYTKENIQWIDNFASLEDCKTLSNYLDTTDDIWNSGAKSVHYIDYIHPEHEDKAKVEDETVINISKKLARNVQDYLDNIYLPEFNVHNGKLLNLRGLELIKWHENCELPSHSDGSEEPPQYPMIGLGSLIYLNDDYVGGEIGFDDFDLSFSPKVGSLIIFPNHMIHHVKLILAKENKTTARRYTLPMFWIYSEIDNYEYIGSIESETDSVAIVNGKVVKDRA